MAESNRKDQPPMSALVEEAKAEAVEQELGNESSEGYVADLLRRLSDALEASERERDEALALTESCSTLKEMAAACIEGAALKLRLEAIRAALAE